MSRTLIAASLALMALAPQQPAGVTPEDLAVIDAALNHKARTAINLARPPVILMDAQTIAPCPDERSGIRCFPHTEKTAKFLQPRMPEVTKERLDLLAARNGSPHTLPAPPAEDVVFVDRQKLEILIKKRQANVHAFTSLPAYFEDGSALLFLGYSCGGLCGQGNFLLLRKRDGQWRVVKSMMTWVS